MTYRFGPYTADRTAYRVFEGDRTVELTPKLLDLLFYLLERPATLVTKEALLDGVWPDANVTDNALAQAISELRDALGDVPSAPTYIRTVARRGYRFVATVENVGPTAPAAIVAPAASPAATPGGPDTAIAVLDFSNVTGDADVAWLSAGIAETVTSDLTALGHFRVIDRWRVVQAARAGAASIRDIGASLGVNLVVTGSFQRSGASLRITARVVNLSSGDAVADAKVDGRLADVFTLQDGIVSTFARALGIPGAGRPPVRETSSLDAFRAYTEGWMKIESLDTDLVHASIADFERAIRADSGFAMAYTGLANAQFVAHEMTRVSVQPDVAALAAGIEHARRAVALDDQLAEAHATLSFLLVSTLQFDEARAAAQRAVTLEPESWRHQYRLGHARWGAARLRALARALALYPQFSYAQFETAMVHVARGQLDIAEQLARLGMGEQDRQAQPGNRFPAVGFHWLLGAIEMQGGRFGPAVEQFERELALVDRRRLYGPEYGAVTLVSRGHAEIGLNRPDAARASFQLARTYVPGYARAFVGEAAAEAKLGNREAEGAAWSEAAAARASLEKTNRPHDALYALACEAALRGDAKRAATSLEDLLSSLPACYAAWTLPIEPCFRALRGESAFSSVLGRLAQRAE